MPQLIRQVRPVAQSAQAMPAEPRRFSIAMATFNGQLYIREQLNSLAEQILLPYELVACDDGSSDNTVSILEEFQKEAPFPVTIYPNPTRLGFADNFLHASNRCTGDWIAFSDQDDIWFPEKLLSVNEAIENSHARDLMLVTHSVQMASDDLPLGNSCDSRLFNARRATAEIWSAAALGGVNRLRYRTDKTIGRNCHPGFWVLPGFTCVFRKELVTFFDWTVRPKSYDGKDPLQGHDRWICMLANALGSVRHIAKPLVLYRRHEAALTGYYEHKSFGAKIAMSKQVGAGRYRFMADAARESAAVLTGLAESATATERSNKLKRSAMLFEKLAYNCELRAEIYGQTAIKDKLVNFTRLFATHGYFGSAFCSLGMSSLLKDLVRCFAGQVSAE
jgi:glycosyltransferase involved in cell wall biosynthesis